MVYENSCDYPMGFAESLKNLQFLQKPSENPVIILGFHKITVITLDICKKPQSPMKTLGFCKGARGFHENTRFSCKNPLKTLEVLKKILWKHCGFSQKVQGIFPKNLLKH